MMISREATWPQLKSYLGDRHQTAIAIDTITPLGGPIQADAEIKGFGYGAPSLVDYRAGEVAHRIVVRPVLRNGYGRENRSDRIGEVFRDFANFGDLPRHVPALDIIGVHGDGRLVSLEGVEECLLITPYVVGTPYAADLVRLSQQTTSTALDRERAELLALYLVEIHQKKKRDEFLWRRRLRDLVGHGEGIMGIIDGYQDVDWVTDHTLRSIEETANRWRWRLKGRVDRLSQVHGDFHPFNILFGEGIDFELIDRSRGSWGAPADDVAALTINYLFFSLQNNDHLTGPFKELHDIFWQTYLFQSQDNEILETIAPWLAWRALVLASPQWYPHLTRANRHGLISFAGNVMANHQFDWQNVHHYFEVVS